MLILQAQWVNGYLRSVNAQKRRNYNKNALERVSYSEIMYRYCHVYIRFMYRKVI